MATIYGGSTNNTLTGTAGNDSIYALGGQDTVYGGAGNDIMDGGTGHDVQYGGAGDDTLIGGTGYDQMHGDDGNDLLIGDDIDYDDIYGGAGNDTVYAGDSDDDWAFGDGGDDVLYMEGGFDLAFGGSGHDTLYGGTGADTLKGDLGNDSLLGEGDNDWLNGGEGADTLDGGSGADLIYGGVDNDLILGGAGADTVHGDSHEFSTSWYAAIGPVNTSLQVTNGADFAVDLYWIDTGGNPVFYATLAPGQSFSTSTGTEHFWYLSESGTSTRLALFTAGDSTTYTFSGDFDDTIDGGSGNDVLRGEYGDDSIAGGLGNDLIDGGSGADTLVGGEGADTLLGGEGDDRIEVAGGTSSLDGNPGIDSIQGGAGADTLAFSQGGGVNVTFSGDQAGSYALSAGGSGSFSQIETVEGTALGDTINAAATTGGIRLDSGDGNDLLTGGSGGDTILFGAGDDTVYGGAGDDFLDDVEGYELGGANLVYGGDGADTLYTGDGNDTVSGDAGNDVMSGEAGDDTLTGGAGNDTIYGGQGADVIELTLSGGQDVVADFDLTPVDGHATDQLDISELRTLSGDPVRWRDVTVSADGNGDAVLTFPEGESVTLQGIAPEQVDGKQEMAAIGIPCFAEGTMIATPQGPVAVQDLRPGMRVLVRGGPPLPVVWIGSRHLDRAVLRNKPDARPYELRCDTGEVLRLSGQHALALRGKRGLCLVRAAHLERLTQRGGLTGARVRHCAGRNHQRYWHFLLPVHALVRANGLWAESLYPGPVGLAALTPSARARLFRVAPALASVLVGAAEVEAAYGPRVLPLLTLRQAMESPGGHCLPGVPRRPRSALASGADTPATGRVAAPPRPMAAPSA